MTNDTRVRANYVYGSLSAALASGDTTLSSAGLANLPVVDATSHAVLTLNDPSTGLFEIVKVTAHTSAATTATIVRGQEGTTARAWASGAAWVHAPTVYDLASFPLLDAPSGRIRADMLAPQPSVTQRVYAPGDYSNSLTSAWTDIDSTGAIDLVVPGCKVGDVVEVRIDGRGSVGGDALWIDVWSVGGSTVRSWKSGKLSPAGLNGGDVGGVIFLTTGSFNLALGCTQQVLASDLNAGGSVVFRLRWRNNNNVTFTQQLFASMSGMPLTWTAINHRSSRILALAADQTWEGGVVQEPSVWLDATGTWNMIYTGGFNTTALGWATAPTALGPWTKQNGGNPILGNGAGGIAAGTYVAHANVYVENGTIYIYYPDALNGGNLKVAYGTTPTSLTLGGTVLAPTGSALGIVNTYLYRDGATYRMLFESRITGPPSWNMGYATGTSPTGTFTVQNFPLSSLQHGTGSYGGPWFTKSGSTWILWYHSVPTSGDLPTDIYRATSTDLVTWTPTPHAVLRRADIREVDQVADVFLVTYQNINYLFWSGMDNATPTGTILVNNPAQLPVTL